MPTSVSNAQPRQSAALRQRVDDEQVGVARYEWNGALSAKVDIRLVHYHHDIAPLVEQTHDLVELDVATRGSIGIGDDDGTRVPLDIVLDMKPELLVERNRLVGDLVKTAVDGIEAVGDVRKYERSVVLEQAEEAMCQDLVR